jgi:hypothetical protein
MIEHRLQKLSRHPWLLGCGFLFLAILVFPVGYLTWMFSQHNAMELNEYHPFRSRRARERFLAIYDMKAKQWPVASESRQVATSFGQTQVRISGPAEAPPLVLLHGGGGNLLQWFPNVAAFSGHYRAGTSLPAPSSHFYPELSFLADGRSFPQG